MITSFISYHGKSFLILTTLVYLIFASGCAKIDPLKESIIIISIDTLRADHLSIYGYHRKTSPNIQEFFKNAVIYDNAFSTSCKTTESHMSMFTSLYPSVHRCETTSGKSRQRGVLNSDVETLAEILKKYGYKTAGFHGGANVNGFIGFNQGFDIYKKSDIDNSIQWIKENYQDKLFLFYHTFHTHDPYLPQAPFDTLYDPHYSGAIVSDLRKLSTSGKILNWGELHSLYWDRVDKSDPADIYHLQALYDGEINEIDIKLKKLFDTIDLLMPDATVIFLSDHGEEFGEHGLFTHEQIYNELLHVPLLIRSSSLKPKRVKPKVSLIGLTPTILELLGINYETSQFQGASFLKVQNDEIIYSELPIFNCKALIKDDIKRIIKSNKNELYDLRKDPFEKNDLDSDKRDVLIKEISQINNFNLAANKALNKKEQETITLDDDVLNDLRALGYIK